MTITGTLTTTGSFTVLFQKLQVEKKIMLRGSPYPEPSKKALFPKFL